MGGGNQLLLQRHIDNHVLGRTIIPRTGFRLKTSESNSSDESADQPRHGDLTRPDPWTGDLLPTWAARHHAPHERGRPRLGLVAVLAVAMQDLVEAVIERMRADDGHFPLHLEVTMESALNRTLYVFARIRNGSRGVQVVYDDEDSSAEDHPDIMHAAAEDGGGYESVASFIIDYLCAFRPESRHVRVILRGTEAPDLGSFDIEYTCRCRDSCADIRSHLIRRYKGCLISALHLIGDHHSQACGNLRR